METIFIGKSTAKAIQVALECSIALDEKYHEGLKTLESHGFDDSNRVELPATVFTANKCRRALELLIDEEEVDDG